MSWRADLPCRRIFSSFKSLCKTCESKSHHQLTLQLVMILVKEMLYRHAGRMLQKGDHTVFLFAVHETHSELHGYKRGPVSGSAMQKAYHDFGEVEELLGAFPSVCRM